MMRQNVISLSYSVNNNWIQSIYYW